MEGSRTHRRKLSTLSISSACWPVAPLGKGGDVVLAWANDGEGTEAPACWCWGSEDGCCWWWRWWRALRCTGVELWGGMLTEEGRPAAAACATGSCCPAAVATIPPMAVMAATSSRPRPAAGTRARTRRRLAHGGGGAEGQGAAIASAAGGASGRGSRRLKGPRGRSWCCSSDDAALPAPAVSNQDGRTQLLTKDSE